MKEYFEWAYIGFCADVKVLRRWLKGFFEKAALCLVCMTLPIWVIPYAIYRKKETK